MSVRERVVLTGISCARHDAHAGFALEDGADVLVVRPGECLLRVVVYEALHAGRGAGSRTIFANELRPVARAPWSAAVALAFGGGAAAEEAVRLRRTGTFEEFASCVPRPESQAFLVWFHFEAALLFFLVHDRWPDTLAEVEAAYAFSDPAQPLPAAFAGAHESALEALGRPSAAARATRQIARAHQRTQLVRVPFDDLEAVDDAEVVDELVDFVEGRVTLHWIAAAAREFETGHALAGFVDSNRAPEEDEVAFEYVDEYDPALHANKRLVCDLRATHRLQPGRLPVAFLRDLPWSEFERAPRTPAPKVMVEEEGSREARELFLRGLFSATGAKREAVPKNGVLLFFSLRPDALAFTLGELMRDRADRLVWDRLARKYVAAHVTTRGARVDGKAVAEAAFRRDFSPRHSFAIHEMPLLPRAVAAMVVVFDPYDERHAVDAARLAPRVLLVKRS